MFFCYSPQADTFFLLPDSQPIHDTLVHRPPSHWSFLGMHFEVRALIINKEKKRRKERKNKKLSILSQCQGCRAFYHCLDWLPDDFGLMGPHLRPGHHSRVFFGPLSVPCLLFDCGSRCHLRGALLRPLCHSGELWSRGWDDER